MPAIQLRLGEVWMTVTYTESTELDLGEVWAEITFSGIMAVTDYIVGQVSTAVGHSRVYNRHRAARERIDFEALFTDSGGLEFWRVWGSPASHDRVGTENAQETVHTVTVEGVVAFHDDDVAADSSEYQLQQHVEDIADQLRPLVTLGGLVETSWLGRSAVDEVEFAGVLCNRAQVGLQAQEFATG